MVCLLTSGVKTASIFNSIRLETPSGESLALQAYLRKVVLFGSAQVDGLLRGDGSVLSVVTEIALEKPISLSSGVRMVLPTNRLFMATKLLGFSVVCL